MRLALLTALLLLLFFAPTDCVAQKSSSTEWITNDAESEAFPDVDPYQPQVIKSYSQVPEHIRLTVERHLDKRLGRRLAMRFNFDIGEIIDHKRLFVENPDARNYEWIVPTYILCYNFVDLAKGFDLYTAHISLSARGKIIEEVNWPMMSKYGSNSELTSHADADRIALNMGFNPKEMHSYLSFDEGIDAVVYAFSQDQSDNGVEIVIRNIEIDAFTGKLVKSYISRAIH